jgi:diphthine synthase
MEKKVRKKMFGSDSVVCVVAQAGSDNPVAKAGTFKDLLDFDFGPPLHSIVIPGRLHFMEIKALMVLAQLPAYLEEKLQKI